MKITGRDIGVDLTRVPVFVGGLLGATLVFVFSSLAIKAVGKAAQGVITEVRRQFKENPGIMAGTSKPDYAGCVDIVTRGALRAMVAPGLLAVLTPVAVGFSFKFLSPYGQIGAESVAGLLMVGTITGILMAMFMNNGGGAWDNAKKYIESGNFKVDGVVVGKKSDPHKAASSATPSATPSRTPRARRSTCSSSCSPRSRWCWRRCLSRPSSRGAFEAGPRGIRRALRIPRRPARVGLLGMTWFRGPGRSPGPRTFREARAWRQGKAWAAWPVSAWVSPRARSPD